MCCPLEDASASWLLTECPAKTLIRLRGCAVVRVFAGRICNLVENPVPRHFFFNVHDVLLFLIVPEARTRPDIMLI